MLDEVLKRQLMKEFREAIKGNSVEEANETKAGELYAKNRHLKQAQHQVDRLTDEIAELRKINVEKELKE